MAADKNLIAGTRVMLEAGRDTSVSSFAREFNTILKSQMEEEAKETADIDRWLNKVGTPDNIRKIATIFLKSAQISSPAGRGFFC